MVATMSNPLGASRSAPLRTRLPGSTQNEGRGHNGCRYGGIGPAPAAGSAAEWRGTPR